MYGVNQTMSQFGSAQRLDRDAIRKPDLSPELREVLHMLEALEQGKSEDTPSER